MNRKTLQKVIDAVKANKVDYALGMLETLMDNLPGDVATSPLVHVPSGVSSITKVNTVEIGGNELDNVASAKLAEVKRMAGDVN